MRRYFWPALAAGVVVSAAASAHAGWFKDFCHGVERDWLRNNAWPEPFNYADRNTVYAPFAVQVNNGWRMQNTLGSYHFTADGTRLNEAGRLKVQSIVTLAQPQHRTIYVEAAESPEVTAERIRAIRETSMRYAVAGDLPEVFATNVPPRGTPGDYVDSVERSFRASTPLPRLPADQGGGTGTAGGGGGSSN